jgi:cytochrome o ubiquinol oxidase subunit 2
LQGVYRRYVEGQTLLRIVTAQKNKARRHTVLRLLFLSPLFLLGGCSLNQVPVLSPDGPIASTERDLLLVAVSLMLIVVIPVFAMAAWFVWHYRARNTRARYEPEWSYSAGIDAIVWLVPAAIVIVLGTLVWNYTNRLDPYKPIASSKPPLHIEAISLDWKWLFIYPQQHIAAVNELVIPDKRPISLKLTSDTVMNSLYLPGLAGQIYAMAGMQTRLNMLADAPAQLTGLNTQYSGSGFADQHFAVRVVRPGAFDAWTKKVRQSPKMLDAANYARLEKPTTNVPVTHYSAVEPDLFDKVIAKYTDGRTPRKYRRIVHVSSRNSRRS